MQTSETEILGQELGYRGKVIQRASLPVSIYSEHLTVAANQRLAGRGKKNVVVFGDEGRGIGGFAGISVAGFSGGCGEERE